MLTIEKNLNIYIINYKIWIFNDLNMSFMNEIHSSLYIINNNKYFKKLVRRSLWL